MIPCVVLGSFSRPVCRQDFVQRCAGPTRATWRESLALNDVFQSCAALCNFRLRQGVSALSISHYKISLGRSGRPPPPRYSSGRKSSKSSPNFWPEVLWDNSCDCQECAPDEYRAYAHRPDHSNSARPPHQWCPCPSRSPAEFESAAARKFDRGLGGFFKV